MLQLHVIEAKFGDCLLLEFGNPSKFILIDGGPTGVYEHSLLPELNRIMGESKTLEALIISHVDMDHIKGILEMLSYLKLQMDGDTKEYIINIKELWINSFSNTIDSDGKIKAQLNDVLEYVSNMGLMVPSNAASILGIQQGHSVLTLCGILKIPVNVRAEEGYFFAGNRKKVEFQDIKFTIVGPTIENLRELEKEWKRWIRKQSKAISRGGFTIKGMTDKSVPNLSSICFLVEGDGKSILFTGDARGDHILAGLDQKNMLQNGRFHCDILKVPHHGSKNNVDYNFFKSLTAETYVISADGKYDNPDYPTLCWIVEAAKSDGRKIRLALTNNTTSVEKLIKNYPEKEWGYSLSIIKDGLRSISV